MARRSRFRQPMRRARTGFTIATSTRSKQSNCPVLRIPWSHSGRRTASRSRTDQMGIWAGSLDSTDVKQLVPENSRFAYAPQGYLLFNRNEAVVAQAFNASTLTLSGDAVTIIPNQSGRVQSTRISVSDGGILIWQPL